jgi:hypothetical protein
MKNKLLIISIAALLGLASCNQDDVVAYIEYLPKIAVEGWIENEAPATVMLSWTASFDQKLDTAYLLKQVIKSAKVSVSNGKETEILTLGMNYSYLPPYVYYGSSLKGKTGESYRLTIEYNNQIITADAYIPEPVPLDSCWFVKASPSDTIGYIHIKFRNTSEAFYQIATRIDQRETVFTPCLYGNFSSAQFAKNDRVSLQINKGPVLFPETQFDTYFTAGNRVYLKFRTQSQESYDFWTSWQNEVLNAQNPIFPANTNLKSNIKGGIGIWCGYGTYNYRIETH